MTEIQTRVQRWHDMSTREAEHEAAAVFHHETRALVLGHRAIHRVVVRELVRLHDLEVAELGDLPLPNSCLREPQDCWICSLDAEKVSLALKGDVSAGHAVVCGLQKWHGLSEAHACKLGIKDAPHSVRKQRQAIELASSAPF